MKNTVITVRLWGEEVGRLLWDERKGNSIFAYSAQIISVCVYNICIIPRQPSNPFAFRVEEIFFFYKTNPLASGIK